jgi:hypothetical protein
MDRREFRNDMLDTIVGIAAQARRVQQCQRAVLTLRNAGMLESGMLEFFQPKIADDTHRVLKQIQALGNDIQLD